MLCLHDFHLRENRKNAQQSVYQPLSFTLKMGWELHTIFLFALKDKLEQNRWRPEYFTRLSL